MPLFDIIDALFGFGGGTGRNLSGPGFFDSVGKNNSRSTADIGTQRVQETSKGTVDMVPDNSPGTVLARNVFAQLFQNQEIPESMFTRPVVTFNENPSDPIKPATGADSIQGVLGPAVSATASSSPSFAKPPPTFAEQLRDETAKIEADARKAVQDASGDLLGEGQNDVGSAMLAEIQKLIIKAMQPGNRGL